MDPRFRRISSVKPRLLKVGVDGAKQKERWEDYLRYSFSGHCAKALAGFFPTVYLATNSLPQSRKCSPIYSFSLFLKAEFLLKGDHSLGASELQRHH